MAIQFLNSNASHYVVPKYVNIWLIQSGLHNFTKLFFRQEQVKI